MKLFYEENNLLSQKQFNNHIHIYTGYIDKVNDIGKRTDEKTIELVNLTSTRRDLQYALDGIILHEAYFENIKTKLSKDDADIFKSIDEFNDWRQDFYNLALNTRGWVIYIYEYRTKQFLNISLESHDTGLVCSGKPIVVLDMYEHAYYTDYANDKKQYIDRFIKNIDWKVAENRISQI